MESFWENVRAKRISLGLSQEDLAKKIGLHQTGVSYFESGKSRRTDRELMERIARVLDTTVEELEGKPEIKMTHFPEEIQRWLEGEECKQYIAEAYSKYINDKMKSLP
ncbi:MAG TPA: helix-turn-helix transcriptional regulator [Selenomonadales bacterium]|nr:helix-turn-helix transcriptional regulator [Selenomonadales bacterium]